MRRSRAFSHLEVIIALILVLMACEVLYLSWKRGQELSTRTRERAVAVLLSQSLLEEIRAHRFGTPAPAAWQSAERPPVEIWIGGRPQKVTVRPQITCQTGAFLGQQPGNYDEVTVTVGTLQVKVPVWRD